MIRFGPRSLILDFGRYTLSISLIRRWMWGYTDYGWLDELPRMLDLGRLSFELFRWHPEGCTCRGCTLKECFATQSCDA